MRLQLAGIWQVGFKWAVEEAAQASGHTVTVADPATVLVMGLPGSNVGTARVFKAAGRRVLVLAPEEVADLEEYREYGLEVVVVPENDAAGVLGPLLR